MLAPSQMAAGNPSGENEAQCMLSPGHVLRHRYTIDRVLGQGGMASVYLATDSTDQRVAIKEMSVEGADAHKAAEQFDREARVLATLQHTNLVAVTDYFDEAGKKYLVMEYVLGTTLEQEVNAAAPPLEQVLEWARQLCDVLEYLHSSVPPVIFRDLKPTNIMLEENGRVRLIDFGIARAFDSRTGTFIKGMGSPGYAPLEQYGTASTDARADIYALGATLYTLLTRTIPPTSVDLAARVCSLAAPASLNVEVTPPLDAALLKMMALHREDRYATVAEARAALFGEEVAAPQPATPQGVKSGGSRFLDNWAPARVKKIGGTVAPSAPPASEAAPLRPFPGLPQPHLAPLTPPSGKLSRCVDLHHAVMGVSYSADRQQLAAALQDGTVVVWAADDPAQRQLLEGHQKAVRAVAFSPHVKDRLASAAQDGTVLLWTVGSSRRPARFHHRYDMMECLAFSPDGRYLAAGSAQKLVKIMDASNCRVVGSCSLSDEVLDVAFAPDGQVLAAVTSDRRVYLMRTPAATPIGHFRGHGINVSTVAFSPDGALMVCGSSDRCFYVWERASGRLIRTVVAHENSVSSVSFSSQGLLATGSWDRTVRLWDVTEYQELHVLRGPTDAVNDLSFSADGTRLAACSYDGTVRIWEI